MMSSTLIKGFVSGAFFGIVVSWVVNCALAEISLNPFFSMVRVLSFIFRTRRFSNVDVNIDVTRSYDGSILEFCLQLLEWSS